MRAVHRGVSLPLGALCFSRYEIQSGNGSFSDKNEKRRKMHFGIDSTKLDLGLNFEKMDFQAVVNATRDAIQKEKSLKFSDVRTSETPASSKANETKREELPPATNTTHRGIVESDIVGHHLSKEELTQEIRSRVAHPSRYTLTDNLKDCSISNNWSKALSLFNGAVEMATKSVLLPASKGLSSLPENEEELKRLMVEKQPECFVILSKLMSAVPMSLKGGNKKSVSGILRWNGKHFYLMLKVLVECGKIKELEMVWSVMKQIGVLDHLLDELGVNNLIALVRRHNEETAATRVKNPSIDLSHNTAESIAEGKAVLRRIVLDLEKVVASKKFSLSARNTRTVQAARVVEAIQQAPPGELADVQLTEKDGSRLEVSDFTGLLRTSKSHASTEKILGLMEKSGVARGPQTYSSVIASLHQAEYVLEGYTTETLPSYSSSSEDRAAYNTYRDQRVKKAFEWFEACPAASRDADIYNQMLISFRSLQYKQQYDTILTEFRGNLLRSKATAKRVEEVVKRREDGANCTGLVGGEVAPIPVELPTERQDLRTAHFAVTVYARLVCHVGLVLRNEAVRHLRYDMALRHAHPGSLHPPTVPLQHRSQGREECATANSPVVQGCTTGE
ncbi:hypothetical protein AGDE_13434 [Angomonas deanei]|uniref:Uncharacterized protein n=1 Tax=Angomonas deanei TaxID=59799 RepID=A0A7G2CBL8_9TRYP|nr:hypothetical protein AGDE_13434 [Angomonas deanei]CAD2216324.1 hypothetical protein, conserved [Angomonas deanei]|eukprot:EPY22386.1 hypothetical protein AGDE_13434 [Angomonas deanei]